MITTVGFQTLMRREIYRFMRMFKRTILPPIVTTLLYILIFGYSLGGHIREVNGFDYIVYILPGLAQMGLITGSFGNASFSVFFAKMEKSIENLLTAPLSYSQIVIAYIFGGMVRGISTGALTLLVSTFFVDFPFEHIFLLILSWFLSSFLFACLGVIIGTLSDSWEMMGNIQAFVITPLIFLGGSFYSVAMLPSIWKKISLVNPILYSVDLARYSLLGKSDLNLILSFSMLGILSLIFFLTAVKLFKRLSKTLN